MYARIKLQFRMHNYHFFGEWQHISNASQFLESNAIDKILESHQIKRAVAPYIAYDPSNERCLKPEVSVEVVTDEKFGEIINEAMQHYVTDTFRPIPKIEPPPVVLDTVNGQHLDSGMIKVMINHYQSSNPRITFIATKFKALYLASDLINAVKREME